MLFSGTLLIQNIAFDAIEDIGNLNTSPSQSIDLNDCLSSRMRCCEFGQSSSTVYPNSLVCDWHGDYSSLSLTPSKSLFEFASQPTSASLTLENVDLSNFLSPHLLSLVKTNEYPFTLMLNTVTIDYVYFGIGLIYHSPSISVNSALLNTNSSHITIQDTVLTNYNPWDMELQIANRKEGYLFYASGTFSGVFKATASSFVNATSSLRSSCYPQTLSHYSLPMNNLLSKNRGSRSDMWLYYNSNHNPNSGSSLISISRIYGAVDISNCKFQNIIGTSGSVLRVDDVLSSNTWFTIYGNIFDRNFAYDSFANIIIAKVSNQDFTKVLDCPRVEIVNSKFINTYGCPGAYGNTLILCPWFSDPNSPSIDYTLSAPLKQKLINWNLKSDKTSSVTVKDSLFENNMLAVSNSLAIIGSYFTTMQNNVFQDCGGTTAEIAKASLLESSFLQRYPGAVTFTPPLIHFGQSTAVLVDRTIIFQSIGNTYQRNWAPWEGSQALGTSLTIKNWIPLWDGDVLLNHDIFAQHQGVPQSMASFLSDESLINNLYTEPVFCISLDTKGSLTIAEAHLELGIPTSLKIILQETTITDNIASYNYDDYKYNIQELGLLLQTLSGSFRYQSGLIKILWSLEAADEVADVITIDNLALAKASFAFNGGVISSNKLMTMGCLFTEVRFLQGTLLLDNEVYMAGETFAQGASVSESYQMPIPTSNQGLVCIGELGTLSPSSKFQVSADNIAVKGNRGILFNMFIGTESVLHLSNSIIVNNTCISLGMITVRNDAALVLLNNIFDSNYNSVGVYYMTTGKFYYGLFNVFMNLDGIYSSVTYMEYVYQFFEGKTKALWNKVSPQYKIFEDGLIPQSSVYGYSGGNTLNFCSVFQENLSYGGLMQVYGGAAVFYDCQYYNHTITGSSVFGVLLSLTSVTMQNILIQNSQMSKDPTMPKSQPALVVILSAEITMNNVSFVGATLKRETMTIFANFAFGSMNGLTLKDLYREEQGLVSLLYLRFSRLAITDVVAGNTTGLFTLAGSKIALSSITVSNIITDYNSQFLFDVSNTDIVITNLYYQGSGKYSSSFPLIGGSKNIMKVMNARFIDATGGTNNIFSQTSNNIFVVVNSIFKYKEETATGVVFQLSSCREIVVQNCVFKSTGSVVRATAIGGGFYFLSNTILTSSLLQNIYIEPSAKTIIQYNHFLRSSNIEYNVLPVSQIHIVDPNSPVNIIGNTMISLYGTTGIIHVESVASYYNLTLENTIFIDNIASQGGALYLSSTKGWPGNIYPTAHLTNSIFIQNRAIPVGNNYGKGGALYLTSPDSTNQTTTLTNCLFIGNTAQTIGGAIYFDYSLPIINNDSVFIENYAGRLNHIGSYPVRLLLITKDTSFSTLYIPGTPLPAFKTSMENYKWNGIGSGVHINDSYTFAIVDMFNQLLYNDNSSTMELYPAGFSEAIRPEFSNEISIKASGGRFTLSDFEFNYHVSGSINVTFTSLAVPAFRKSPLTGLVMLPSILFQVNFRDCGMGEFTLTTNGLTSCQECPAGYWYLSPAVDNSACISCNLKSTICRGGNHVGPRNGYWRMSKYADLVLQCPRPASCLGNNDDVSTEDLDPLGKCADGYLGNLCYNCLPGYARGNNYQCINCHKSVVAYLIVVVMMLLQVGVIGYGVRETLKQDSTQQSDASNAILLRIIINYSQMFTWLMGISIDWPGAMKSFLNFSDKLYSISEELSAVDCFFSIGKLTIMKDTVFFKALLSNMNPIMICLAGTFFWVVYFKRTKRPIIRNREFTNRLITTIIIVCFSMQATIVKTSFGLFQCKNLYRSDEPKEYLVEDYSIKCWQGKHITWIFMLLLPSLIIWILVLPGIILYVLRKNKRNLAAGDTLKRYSFIYNGYRKDKYFWEFVIMVRKIFIISSIVFISPENSGLQIFLFLLLILISYALHVVNKPYTDPKLNKLEQVALISIGIINISGLYFKVITYAEGLNVIMIGTGVIGALYFTAYFVRLFLALQIERLKRNERILKAWGFIKNKLMPCMEYLEVLKRFFRKVVARIKRPFKRRIFPIRTVRVQMKDKTTDQSPNDTFNLGSGTSDSNRGKDYRILIIKTRIGSFKGRRRSTGKDDTMTIDSSRAPLPADNQTILFSDRNETHNVFLEREESNLKQNVIPKENSEDIKDEGEMPKDEMTNEMCNFRGISVVDL